MAKHVLEMEFKDSADRKLTLRIDEPKDNLDSTQVTEAMNALIDNDVFANGDYAIVQPVAARKVLTTTTDFIIE